MVTTTWSAAAMNLTAGKFPFNEDEIREIAKELKGKVESIAIISVFSPITAEHEQRRGDPEVRNGRNTNYLFP